MQTMNNNANANRFFFHYRSHRLVYNSGRRWGGFKYVHHGNPSSSANYFLLSLPNFKWGI